MALVKYNNRSILNVTAFDSIPSGGLNLITTNTISSGVSSSSFTSNIDSTYDTYMFKFINIHPATDGADIVWQCNSVGGSGFNETITSTFFDAYHSEGGAGASNRYLSDYDQAQGTAYQFMTNAIGNDNDQCLSGEMYFFNPSSTTFVKNFMHTINTYTGDNYSENQFGAGYVNTTSAIDEIQFKINSGNMDSGKIKLYGIKDS